MSSYKTIFISDTHLGSASSRSKELNKFLKTVECDNIYLVGDIFDLWVHQWNKHHHKVIETTIKKITKGVDIIYIPGNHDEAFREMCGVTFHNVKIKRKDEYVDSQGRKILVCHGDEFDSELLKQAVILQKIGSHLYDALVSLNTKINRIREFFGLKYWPISSYVKTKFKMALNYVGLFENKVIQECVKNGYAGIICGHIHYPEIRTMAFGGNNFTYMNCGDWVENLSGIAETKDGRFVLFKFVDNEIVELGGI